MAMKARWAGTCGGCGTSYEYGTMIFLSDEYSGHLAEPCCGQLDDSIEVTDTRGEATPNVMPRGKTFRDKCPDCFQIPSSNGTCGCHS